MRALQGSHLSALTALTCLGDFTVFSTLASSSVNSTDENINVLSQSSDLDKEALDENEKKARAKKHNKSNRLGD